MHIIIVLYLTLINADMQTMLDYASKGNPHAIWWIKDEGCDVPDLYESVTLKWSGNIDLNTGELQAFYKEYRARLRFIAEIGLKTRQGRCIVMEDLKKVRQQLADEKDFAIQGSIHNAHSSWYWLIPYMYICV